MNTLGFGKIEMAPDIEVTGNSLMMNGSDHDRVHYIYSSPRGFTLIEIMVVIVILGILAALIVPRIMDRPDQARIVKVEQDIKAIESALKLYRLDNHAYPSTDEGLEVLVVKPEGSTTNKTWKDGGYLDRIPVDPWGTVYQYLNPGVHASIDIYSLGADRQPGGEGMDADIGNWNID